MSVRVPASVFFFLCVIEAEEEKVEQILIRKKLKEEKNFRVFVIPRGENVLMRSDLP